MLKNELMLQSVLQQCQHWKENAEREDGAKVKQITEEEKEHGQNSKWL